MGCSLCTSAQQPGGPVVPANRGTSLLYAVPEARGTQGATAQAFQYSHVLKRQQGVQLLCLSQPGLLPVPLGHGPLIMKVEGEDSELAWLRHPDVRASGNVAACRVPESLLLARTLISFEDTVPARLSVLLASSAAKGKNPSLAQLADGMVEGSRMRACVLAAPPRTLKQYVTCKPNTVL